MKRTLLIGLALGFCLALATLPGRAAAGESGASAGAPGAIGCIRTDDAGTISNINTGYGNGLAFGNCTPFTLSTANQKLTIQCNNPAYVLTDIDGVDAGNGIQLAALEKFTTSINSNVRTATKSDGGSYTGGIVSIAAISTASVICKVWSRVGTE